MITFKEYLSELLNRKVQYTVDRETNSQFQTSANIGERMIKFSAWTDDSGAWEILFSEKHKNKAGETYAATGSGNELEVFSMIRDSIHELISKYAPESISFSAEKEDRSRATVYDRLLARFKVAGYSHKKIDTGAAHHEFTIVRDDA